MNRHLKDMNRRVPRSDLNSCFLKLLMVVHADIPIIVFKLARWSVQPLLHILFMFFIFIRSWILVSFLEFCSNFRHNPYWSLWLWQNLTTTSNIFIKGQWGSLACLSCYLGQILVAVHWVICSQRVVLLLREFNFFFQSISLFLQQFGLVFGLVELADKFLFWNP